MKLRTAIVHAALAVVLNAAIPFGVVAKEPDPGQIMISVGRLLEQGHYSRKRIDNEVSRQLFAKYLDALDYNRLFFTQADVEGFRAKYEERLDEDIGLGDPSAAFDIYDTFVKRVEDRIEKVLAMVGEAKFDFSTQRTVELKRDKSPWPKDEAEADVLWRDRLTNEFLAERLAEGAVDSPETVLKRRYDQFRRNIREQTREDALKIFLNALALSFDPHSEYLSRSDLETFNINMRLKLVGIGAVLQSEDGYAKIKDIVVGGPAEKDGRLKVGDRICAVAQGDGDFEDTVGMKLDRVVERIRGKKGTRVRLQVIPVKAADASQRKVIEIVRDEVKLKDAEAKAELIEMGEGPSPERIGWITLPSFYAQMDRDKIGEPTSTTADVRRLLTRLRSEGISVLVVDLRRNGGGSLEEAINLTGLFINKGPVVQSKDANGNVHVSRDKEGGVVWGGPMIVLTNRLSASASEIFAAALQDYGRAVIVGDSSTFGKGTVQTMLEIGRYIPFLGSDGAQAGALKLTIQKFYRIAGGSTQLRGVVPDIRLPSAYDNPEIGEASLSDPLPYDEVGATSYEKAGQSLFLKDLKAKSAERVAQDREFRYLKEDLQRFQERVATNRVSLNEKVRKAEIAEDKARKEKREAERTKRKAVQPRVYVLTLDNVDAPKLQLASEIPKKPKPADEEDPEVETSDFDAVRAETIKIAGDLAALASPSKSLSAK